METKHCENCGRVIPANAEFCKYCGATQHDAQPSEDIHATREELYDQNQSENETSDEYKQAQPDPYQESEYDQEQPEPSETSEQPNEEEQPNVQPSNTSEVASLSHLDWCMILINLISCVAQIAIAYQVMTMPFSRASTEVNVVMVIMVAGIIISAIDTWESYSNSVPFSGPVLGMIGNLVGLFFASASQISGVIALGAVVLIGSFYLIKRALGHIYR